MKRRTLYDAITIALLSGLSGIGYAQRGGGNEHDGNDSIELYDDATAQVISLSDWSYDELYEGWSADSLLGMPVRGRQGAEIGEAKNLLINRQGQIVAMIAEVGGLGDIGDMHVAIPWGDVQRGDGAVDVPLTKDTMTEYGLFEDDFFSYLDEGNLQAVTEDLRTGPMIWKATELLDDYVVIENGEPYGYVDDLVFDDAGNLESVIVNASNPELGYGGDYAYPWYGRDWRPTLGAYSLPYTREQIAGLTLFNYDQFLEEAGP